MMIAPVAIHQPIAAEVSPYVVDGSDIVMVVCEKDTGTAFYVGNHRFLTARHVAVGEKCWIGGKPVAIVSMGPSPQRDWALVSADVDLPFRVVYSCDRMTPGGYYLSTGYASGNAWQSTTRLRASDAVDADDHARVMRGMIVPGMSGGPVSDLDGVVYGINSWQFRLDADAVPTSGVVEVADTSLCGRSHK